MNNINSVLVFAKIILTNSIITDKKVQDRFNLIQIGSKKDKKISG